MLNILRVFEKIILIALVLMMGIVIFLATLELGWILVRDVVTPPLVLLDIQELLELFGFFLLVLIGIELLETIRAYFVEHVVHVEVVIEVAIIAIARKVIILDVEKLDSLTLVGIAAIIVTLAAAYWVVNRHIREKREAH